MSREELLNGLKYVRRMLDKIQTVMVDYIKLERQFRATQKEIGTTSVADRTKLVFAAIAAVQVLFFGMIAFMTGNFLGIGLMIGSVAVIYLKRKDKMDKLKLGAIAVFVLCFVWNLYLLVMGMTPGIAIILGVFFAIVVGGGVFLITAQNRRIAEHNRKVEENNERVRAQRAKLYSQYEALAEEMYAHSSGWFPPNYYAIEAVDFFIRAVENYRAESVKEMVNLFEQNEQFREMAAYQQQQVAQLNRLVEGQQEIVSQLRFTNMMQVANFIRLGDVNSSVKEVNASVRSLNRTVNDIYTGMPRGRR